MILSDYLHRICGDSFDDYYTEPIYDFDVLTEQTFVREVRHYVLDGVMLAFDIKKIFNECSNVDSIFADGDKLVIVERV